MRESILTNTKLDEDLKVDNSLRPSKFEDFIGQEKIKENLKIYVESAKIRNDCLDHVLLHGPPGLGKTTLSNIIAKELGVEIKITSGPVLEKAADLAGLLTNLNEHDVLFIDEIHRLSPVIEEYLYPAMEDYKIEIMIDSGPHANSVQMALPKFTLIGATTKSGNLTAPLRARFGIINRMEYYDDQELYLIVKRSAKILGIKIDDEGAMEIAKRSRSTPRIANRILRRVRDFAIVKSDGKITKEIATIGLRSLEIDSLGFDAMDRDILLVMMDKFNGGPVGIKNIAVAVGEETDTIEEVYEPYLIKKGFIQRTPRGRIITKNCYKYFGKEINSGLFEEF